ncbi:MAG: 3-deoxy-manno-octulosonate cytidylyltransferase [Flavobacterium sp.]|nr:MAG: 3-deoxy-manno-octulosonate cytidylyltransferase [Flavobacterium sp.]
MNFKLIIPARYKSSRFPGKPLEEILGTSLIQRVWTICVQAVGNDDVYIATDDERIASHCRAFNGNIVMTSEDCETGTDRVAEAASLLKADLVLNVQGDEPLLKPGDILAMKNKLIANPNVVHNAMCLISSDDEFFSLSTPKVVFSESNMLLYMSRSPIPGNKLGQFKKAYKQVCIYGFNQKSLEIFGRNRKKSAFENLEDIEILRFLEKDIPVQVTEVANASLAVDFPGDIQKVEDFIRKNRLL